MTVTVEGNQECQDNRRQAAERGEFWQRENIVDEEPGRGHEAGDYPYGSNHDFSSFFCRKSLVIEHSNHRQISATVWMTG